MPKFTCIPNLGKEGGGSVWDTEKGRVLARFDQNGEFETDDEVVIEKLNALGYARIDAPPAQETVKPKRKTKYSAED